METQGFEITPSKRLVFNFREIWERKELLYFFAWRDVKVKYKQAYLGILWSILQPLLMMGLMYLVFHQALNINSSHAPYPIYLYSGLLLWGIFASSITNSVDSMLANAQIIRKIYFPRLVIPIACSIVALVDFLFGLIVFFLLLIIYQHPVSWTVVFYIPLAVIMVLVSALGISTLLSALTIKYRDFKYILPFGIQLVFFASQIVYALDDLHQPWLQSLLYLNPFNGAIELFRYPIGMGSPNYLGILISCSSMFLFCIVGLIYFKSTENFFADVI